MKYKVGDKVRIVSCEYGHGFNLGDIVKISKVGETDYEAIKNGESWYVDDEEVEPAATESEEKGSKMLEAGKTYLDVSNRKYVCLFITDKYAYMGVEEGFAAYVWNKNTGESISLNSGYDIQTETVFKEV